MRDALDALERAEQRAQVEARKARRKNRKHGIFWAAARGFYDELVAAQGHERCAICDNPRKRIRLNIDHDHKTMRVRGLLCSRCNRLLHSWVTPAWLRAAAGYLEKPPLAIVVKRNV